MILGAPNSQVSLTLEFPFPTPKVLQLRRDAYGSPEEVLMFVAFLLVALYQRVLSLSLYGALLDFFSMPHFQDVEPSNLVIKHA